jgi:hypothetical protein
MGLNALEQELLKLQKFHKNQINLLQNGVRLAGVSGKQIDDLLREASAARFRLARRFLRSSKHLALHKPVLYRDVVSRAYYAVYHAARAVSFLTHPGDDYEHHDKVANGLILRCHCADNRQRATERDILCLACVGWGYGRNRSRRMGHSACRVGYCHGVYCHRSRKRRRAGRRNLRLRDLAHVGNVCHRPCRRQVDQDRTEGHGRPTFDEQPVGRCQ